MSGNEKIQDLHLHFLVLLILIIEKIEELERSGQLFGKVKNFLRNSKKYFESFIDKVYNRVEKQEALDSTVGVVVIKERVEKALLNQYVISEYERERRLKELLINRNIVNEKEIEDFLKEVSKANILKH